jgi:all-trans-8'-apo-beta-carotenal 15,15'-oxygenase
VRPALLQPSPAWRGIFKDLPREHGFEPLHVEGRLPADLCGVLYRCGPARFGIGGEPYLHWFDGDGGMTAVRFRDGRSEGATRIVETRWRREERAANRQLYRSYAQTGRGWRRWLTLPKNPANVSVMPWGGQVLALWEAGLPIALDPESLEARGETTLGGRIGPTFSAHPHRVGDDLFNFGVRYGRRFSIDLYALGNDVRRVGSVPLPRPTIIHDFIATPRHLVFFCPPVRLRLARLLAGVGSFDENLAWEPEHGTEVVVVPLAAPEAPIRFTVPPFFQWHFVNAWEESGTLVVDYLPYSDFETNAWFGRAPFDPPCAPPPSSYARARLDLASRRMEVQTLSTASWEFPAVHPGEVGRHHAAAWLLSFGGAGTGLPPVLCRFDPATGVSRAVPLEPGAFPGEPVLVPRADGPGAAWVLSVVYDGGRDASCVAVVDADRPEEGPVARAWFDHGIPLSFHGAWKSENPR